jgi:hypothetical protein
MEQLAPAATVAPQSLVSAKSPGFVPVNAMLAMLKAALPELLRVTDCGALATPTGWLEIVMLLGERLGAGKLSDAVGTTPPPPPQDTAHIAIARQNAPRSRS